MLISDVATYLRKIVGFRNVARAANQGNEEAIKLLHVLLSVQASEHTSKAFEIRFWGSR